MKRKLSLKGKLFIITLFICLLGLIGMVFTASYAFFTTRANSKDFVIYTGSLAVDYQKNTDVLNLKDLYPMTNTEGLNLDASHEFTITNNGNIRARYQIRLEVDNTIKNMIPIEYIKLSYSKNNSSYSEPVLLSNLNSSFVFIKNQVLATKNNNENQNYSDTYSIKLWIDISAPNEIQGKEFKARVVVDSIQDVEYGYEVDTAPIITLNKDENGNQDIHLKVDETYIELGVEKIEDDKEVFTSSDVKISYEYYDGETLTTVDQVDTSKEGIYYINYSVTDKSNNIGQVVRVVTVNNNTLPSIELNGEEIITINTNQEFIDPSVTVDEGKQIIVLGEVKTSTAGTYTIRYIVIDEKGNLNSVVRTVYVVFSNNTCQYEEGTNWTINYSTGEQTFEVPCRGIYKIEAAGTGVSGNGTLVTGYSSLISDDMLYIYAGSIGSGTAGSNSKAGGQNGGGATVIRLNSNTSEPIIVAGGGGGSTQFNDWGKKSQDTGFSTPSSNGIRYNGSAGTSYDDYCGTDRHNYALGTGGGGGGYYGGNAGGCSRNDCYCYAHRGAYAGTSYIDFDIVFNYNESTNTQSVIEYTGTNGGNNFVSDNVEYGAVTGNGYATITLISLGN